MCGCSDCVRKTATQLTPKTAGSRSGHKLFSIKVFRDLERNLKLPTSIDVGETHISSLKFQKLMLSTKTFSYFSLKAEHLLCVYSNKRILFGDTKITTMNTPLRKKVATLCFTFNFIMPRKIFLLVAFYWSKDVV